MFLSNFDGEEVEKKVTNSVFSEPIETLFS